MGHIQNLGRRSAADQVYDFQDLISVVYDFQNLISVVGIKSLAGFIENEQGRRFDHRPRNQNHPLLSIGDFEKVILCKIFEI